MVKKDFSKFPANYGYIANRKLFLLSPNFKKAKKLVQTLSDLQGKDMYLYSLNLEGEIYYCRKITCVQNKCKGGAI